MNILLTSVGRRSYIIENFKEALVGKGKVFATNSVFTNSLLCADQYELSPLIYDKSYIDFILGFCKRHEISAILSLFDVDLPVLANNAKMLKSVGARFIGPSVETAQICNDKLMTSDFIVSLQLCSPKTYTSLFGALSAINIDALSYPVIIKPRFGMGSIGIYCACNENELRVFFEKCRIDIFESYLKYESSMYPDDSVLIQEYINGQEYGLDLYKDLEGKYVGIVAKKKIAMRSGETDIGEVVDANVFEYFGQRIANGLSFTGILSVDCFLSEDKIFCTEINPRISGHYPFSHLAGVRYPDQLVAWLEGRETNTKFFSHQVGVRGSKELVPRVLFG